MHYRRITLVLISIVYRVYERGERGGDPAAAFWQLQHPNPNNPTFIFGLGLSLGHDICFRMSIY